MSRGAYMVVRNCLSPFTRSLATIRRSMSSFANFDLVNKFKLAYTDTVVSKWKSRVTGLSVVHLDYDGNMKT